MFGRHCLNGTWKLTYASGVPLLVPDHYTAPTLEGRGLWDARVPAPIHQVLMDAGLLDDPNIGMNSLRAWWVEEQYWIYRHVFTAPPEAASSAAWLVFERLEFDAQLWLNGEPLGAHANAHRPARFDATGKLKAGDNLLVVRLSSGMHANADKPSAEYAMTGMDQLTKRVFQRKPQYQTGWDWNARLTNVGILGSVYLEWSDVPRLDAVTVFAIPDDNLRNADMHIRATIETTPAMREVGAATLRARIVETGQTAALTVDPAPGASRHEMVIFMDRPRLWWPVNHGPQDRYTVEVELEAGGVIQATTRRTGVRSVAVDQSKHPETGRYFTLQINNRPIFCKGGNWVPADLMYSTVTPERYRELVQLARDANFNMLRVWGGGLYADHALCEACDEAGIMLWHDFLFACGKYPGDDPAFAAEVRHEVTHIVRELAHHPSLVVWCGNNEIEWGDWAWGYDDKARTHPHYAIFHHDIPKIVHDEDPSTFHWLSSPHSPDFMHPNDPTVGDQHPWGVSIITPGPADWWEYRGYVDRFPNEGGVLGASPLATLRRFLPENERYVLSPSWEHHDNPFSAMTPTPGGLGRTYATVALWTGRDPLAMAWDEYAFVSGLMQAEGLTEYITNYRRRMFSSAAAIFWMYNDSWPVTHGWTIVDYYRHNKLSYHPVRRAFQPVTVVVALTGEDVVVYGVNDTPDSWLGQLRCGLFTLSGQRPSDTTISVRLEANASTPLATLDRTAWDALGVAHAGAFAVLLDDNGPIAQHRLFRERFKNLHFAKPDIRLERTRNRLTLTSDVFVWGVCLDVEGDKPVADNCFDLLPGIAYSLPWDNALGEPAIARIGSRDAVAPA